MPNKVMEHTSTDEKTCDKQTTQEDTRNNQVADIGIACFVAAPGLVARPTAPIHDDLCPPFDANCDPETGRNPALDPLTCPTPADESARAGHPLPQGGEGLDFGSLGVRHWRSRRPMHRNTSAQMWDLQSRATPVLRMVTYALHLGIVKWQQRPAFQTCSESPNPNAADAENRRPVHPVKLGT